jgi:DNA-binding beta-propeller fold protein YncE
MLSVAHSEVLRRSKSAVIRCGGRLAPFLLIILVYGCSSPTEDLGPVPLVTQGVYVLSEGVAGQNNSTLTYFVPDSNKVSQDVFQTANGRPVGDAARQMVVSGSFAYLLVSGSKKIEVMRTSDNVSIATISLKPGQNPFSLTVDGNYAYVTNCDAPGSLTVIDLTANRVQRDSIIVGFYPEGLTTSAGQVFVCNADKGSGRTVSVIDEGTGRLLRNIVVSDGPSCADVAPDGSVWILCTGSVGGSGGSNTETPGNLFVIDPIYDIVVDSIFVGGHPSGMTISLDGFVYVVEGNRILKYNGLTYQLVTSGFVVGSPTSNFDAIAVDDYTNLVYVADAKDFVQSGEVRIYTADSFLQGRFDTGVAPVSIAFKR